jgi:hypothetical protein
MQELGQIGRRRKNLSFTFFVKPAMKTKYLLVGGRNSCKGIVVN